MGIVNVVGMVLLLGTILGAAGVFVYLGYTQGKLDEQKITLNDIRSQFSQSDIEKIRDLDTRIETAESLLAEHLSPLKVFSTLESLTQNKVAYEDFSYQKRGSGDVTVALVANTKTFNTIALQSSAYKDNKIFGNSLVTDLAIVEVETDDEEVSNSQIDKIKTFTLTADIARGNIVYQAQESSNEFIE